MSRDTGRDAYGPLPDYHACFRTPAGKCMGSGKYQYDSADGRVCGWCVGLSACILPGTRSCCACGAVWTIDPISQLPYCARCEATAGKRPAKVTAQKHLKPRPQNLRQISMRFDDAS